MTASRNITNVYVGPDFLSDDLTARKTEDFTGLIDKNMRQNHSSFPVAAYHYQLYNFSRDSGEKRAAIIMLLLIFAAPLLLIKKRYNLMYFSACALAGFEITVLLTLQIMIGNMYQLTGLVIAGFMAGLALGSGTRDLNCSAGYHL